MLKSIQKKIEKVKASYISNSLLKSLYLLIKIEKTNWFFKFFKIGLIFILKLKKNS